MNGKNFFHFTGKEKNGILILFCLIIGICIGRIFVPKSKLKISQEQEIELNAPVKKRKNIKLVSFDPNIADSTVLSDLGLEQKVVKNIIRYREKGGKFKKAEDLSKIYGIKVEELEELKPYIRITELTQDRISGTSPKSFPEKLYKKNKDSTFRTRNFIVQEKYSEGIHVNIEIADTSELKKIPGIGSSFAKRIVKYRQLLGGFYSVEQVKEVYGMTPEMYEKISRWMKIEHVAIEQIHVNKSSLDKLKSHPYINFYQARVMIELRNKKGKLQNIQELSIFEEFTDFDIQRLSPYLSFN